MLSYVALGYIGPAIDIQLILGVATSCSNFLLTTLSHCQNIVLYDRLIPEPGTAAAIEGYAELLAAFSHVSIAT